MTTQITSQVDSNIKYCKKCNTSKPISEFWEKKNRWSSSILYQSECKDCSKELVRKYRAWLKEKTGIQYKPKPLKERYKL